MPSIKEKIVETFGGQIVTAKQLWEWYTTNKAGGATAYRSNLYQNIVKPMLANGSMVQVGRGLYEVTHYDYVVTKETVATQTEEDEFDLYIQSKLGSARPTEY